MTNLIAKIMTILVILSVISQKTMKKCIAITTTQTRILGNHITAQKCQNAKYILEKFWHIRIKTF